MAATLKLTSAEQNDLYTVNWHTSWTVTNDNYADRTNAGDGYLFYYDISGAAYPLHAIKFTGTQDTSMRGCFLWDTDDGSNPEYGIDIYSTTTITPPNSTCCSNIDKQYLFFEPGEEGSEGSCANTDYDTWAGGAKFYVAYSRWATVGDLTPPSNVVLHLGQVMGLVPPEPTFNGEDYSSRRKITVHKEVVTGSPTNVHVMLDLTGYTLDNELLYSVLMYQKGALLQVLTSAGVECPCDVGVKNNDNGTLSVRLYFLAPELSSSQDNTFYLDYGNRNSSTAIVPYEMWRDTRSSVWHFGHEVWGEYIRGVV